MAEAARQRSWLGWRAIAPGTPRRHALTELALVAVVLVLAAATPPLDRGGAANAPFAGFVARHLGGSVCPYRHLTGIECPGCGLTRSFVQLAHGNVGMAVRLNPLGPVLFALLVAHAIDLGLAVLLRRRLEVRLDPALAWRLWGALAAGFAVLGVARVVAHFA
jgi:hypothetical protein